MSARNNSILFQARTIAIIILAVLASSFRGASANPSTSLENHESYHLWTYQPIDQPRHFPVLSEHSLRFDSNGLPHIAYGGNNLYFAWFDGLAWNYEIVDNSDDTGLGAALVIDQNDFAHIGYIKNSGSGAYTKAIKYAFENDSGWHIEVAETNAQEPYYPYSGLSFVLDSSGYPHFSAFRGPELIYVYKDDLGWHSETITTYFNQKDTKTSLRLDAQGYAAVAISKQGGLGYIKQTESAWEISEPIGSGNLTSSASLVIDQYGYPHISYVNVSDNERLYHAYQDAQGWHTETIGNDTGVREASIVLDSENILHVVFSKGSYQPVGTKYALWDGVAWQVEEITDEVGDYNSIGITANGEIGVTYYLNDRQKLNYVHKIGDVWANETVDKGRDTLNAAFAMDQNGYAKVAYLRYNYYGSDLMFASQSDTGWDIVPLDQAGNVRGIPSIVLDELGYSHISYMNGALNYMYEDEDGWHTQVVDPDIGISASSFLRLDPSGFVRIAYYSSSIHKTRYAYLDEVGWHIDTDIENYQGLNETVSSFILFPDGHPGIFCAGYKFRYIFQDAGGWHTEVLDSIIDFGSINNSGAVIHPNGDVMAIYNVNAGSGAILKLATKDMSGWHIQELRTYVSPRESVFVFTNDLGMDSNGLLYSLFDIAYDRSPGSSEFEHEVPGGVWEIQRLIMPCSKLAIYQGNEIYMLCNQANGTLVLADPHVPHFYFPLIER